MISYQYVTVRCACSLRACTGVSIIRINVVRVLYANYVTDVRRTPELLMTQNYLNRNHEVSVLKSQNRYNELMKEFTCRYSLVQV